MLLSLLLLVQATPEIVITGKRLEAAHAACISDGCTPIRDAQASIALAEARFRTGDYLEAKSLLAAAISRNKDKAGSDPKPVAALYEAYATVTLHEGNQDDYRKAVFSQVRTLHDNLPADDPARLAATTAVGDMWLNVKGPREAERAYEAAERNALNDGQGRAAMLAGMKRAWLFAARGQSKEAGAKLDELQERPIAAQPGYRTALRVMRLRLAARDAKGDALDDMIKTLGTGQDSAPLLVKAPRYEADAATSARDMEGAIQTFNSEYLGSAPHPCQTAGVDPIQWIDIGFWIRPDGRTADAEVLRQSPNNPWTDIVLEQVAGRRYSASAPTAGGGEGFYKVERLTRRSKYLTPACSAIKRRAAVGGFETLDLTEEGSAVAPPSRMN